MPKHFFPRNVVSEDEKKKNKKKKQLDDMAANIHSKRIQDFNQCILLKTHSKTLCHLFL